MAVTFAGRWESQLTVPSGGASVSASNANGGSAATVTVPAGNFYLTAAGSISGLVSTLQTQLNATAALHGFPHTAAVMSTVVGGDWTNGSGWLCQEASGDLAPVFGAVTLADSGTPTYQNAGIKDGDYAVGFDATAEYFSGGDVHDVGATDDLIVAWVGYHAATIAANRALVSKRDGNTRWLLYRSTADSIVLNLNDGTDNVDATAAVPIGSWYVGVAVIDRGASQARVATCALGGSLTVGTTVSTTAIGSLETTTNFQLGAAATNTVADIDFLCSALYVVTGASVADGLSAGLSAAVTSFAAAINAAWSVTLSDTTGQVTIDWTGYATPTWSLTWTTDTLRDVLGFTANISGATSSTTGASQSPACWLPDAPLNVDGHPAMTPEETDLRVTESPTGVTLGLAGNTKYAHSNLRYRRVPVDRIREASASLTNASLEVFLRNTQFGQGDISWFTPASPCQVWWNSAGTLTLLGDDANSSAGVDGWTIVGISSFSQAVRLSQDGYVGQFDVTFPRLVSSG